LPKDSGPATPEPLLPSLTNALFDLSTAVDLIAHSTATRLEIKQTDLICLHLLRNGPMSPGTVAARLGLTTAAISAMATRLEADGFAFREMDPTDRRRVLMHASPSGMQLASDLFARISEVTEELASARSDTDLRMLVALADQFRRAITDHAAALRIGPPPHQRRR
jgi:DNA-binding MarR family transcriptional regulator